MNKLLLFLVLIYAGQLFGMQPNKPANQTYEDLPLGCRPIEVQMAKFDDINKRSIPALAAAKKALGEPNNTKKEVLKQNTWKQLQSLMHETMGFETYSLRGGVITSDALDKKIVELRGKLSNAMFDLMPPKPGLSQGLE